MSASPCRASSHRRSCRRSASASRCLGERPTAAVGAELGQHEIARRGDIGSEGRVCPAHRGAAPSSKNPSAPAGSTPDRRALSFLRRERPRPASWPGDSPCWPLSAQRIEGHGRRRAARWGRPSAPSSTRIAHGGVIAPTSQLFGSRQVARSSQSAIPGHHLRAPPAWRSAALLAGARAPEAIVGGPRPGLEDAGSRPPSRPCVVASSNTRRGLEDGELGGREGTSSNRSDGPSQFTIARCRSGAVSGLRTESRAKSEPPSLPVATMVRSCSPAIFDARGGHLLEPRRRRPRRRSDPSRSRSGAGGRWRAAPSL